MDLGVAGRVCVVTGASSGIGLEAGRRLCAEAFSTRILGKEAVCIHGREAAALFYDPTRFERQGALPRRVVTSLFGKRAIHTLDDEPHRRRKAAFLSLMGPASLDALIGHTWRAWQHEVRSWPARDSVVLFEAAQRVLTAAVCTWAGVPVSETELAGRARDLAHMVDAFGGVGPRLWRGKLARIRTERWIGGVIDDARRGAIATVPGSALHVMAHAGGPRDAHTAAVELINVLRPTVAIAWYVAFAALALHERPEVAARLAREPATAGAGAYTDQVMQEIRRLYPFTPYLGARVRSRFTWRGHTFEPGTLVLLDVYGTDHDPRIWDEPDEFRPERFAHWTGDPYTLIPQGGGDRATGHRCPGEWITMHEVALALHLLTRGVDYELAPEQDLGFDLNRMPTVPRSGVVLRAVRLLPALDADPPRPASQTAAIEAAASVLDPPYRAPASSGPGAPRPAR